MSYMSSCDELAFRGRRVILLDKLHQFVQEQWEAEVKQRLCVFLRGIFIRYHPVMCRFHQVSINGGTPKEGLFHGNPWKSYRNG